MYLLLKGLAIWAAFIPIAILNGLLREKCLALLLGSRLALPLSGISGALLFFLLVYLALPWFGALKVERYWLIGGGWLALTVFFEFAFGRLVMGKSWLELLQAYHIEGGNLWLLMLFVITVSPYWVARLRGLAA